MTISIAPCKPSISLVGGIRQTTKLGVLEIHRRLLEGAPLFDQELFGNRAEDVFAKLRELLAAIEDGGYQPLVTEAGRLITPQILRNIIRASEDGARKFNDLGRA